ncbi:hypothetical protein CANTEDRAFT_115858 [Yamadazyma tenuis ATCC 10573]|uniref:Uncharacterized protein n=1 Tax=Candida tenuis (strain ATCC 10573 / BCRC 21748 / CBS 615 / JCM 9827 / NBRC 10315 / NRRL Y-1498 / VKM Y-70) TaxID=590646 RepID=G3B8H5_CANTC|nr:uncharacterized protein CANTEDRAFT_115858 [Yamadazyma tenuis ATCC 10573]EGV62395.1 hypothetical protein CANTEDRAFT_115858 [Yamadazyma tenuis ATCC 10573]
MSFWKILPALALTPFHAIVSGLYAYSIKLAVDKETYEKYCEKQNESFKVIFEHFGHFDNSDSSGGKGRR